MVKKYLDKNLTVKERAKALVDEMTLEEAAAQLVYDAPAIERLGVPAYNWWNEGLHGLARSGTATVLPQAIGMAATFDRDLVRQAAEITAEEARAKFNSYQKYGDTDIYKGLTIWSPNVNIFRDPRWGRGHETYGEDPYLTGELGKEYVRGLQGEGKYLKTAACAKHLAAHSGPEGIRHGFDAKVSAKDLEETYLPAFEELVCGAGVESVMGAYNSINGEPACASETIMQKLREWDFEGYFVSDCGAINDFHQSHHITQTPEQSAAMALKAGCDINCGGCYRHLMTAYDMGLVSEEDIRRSCQKAMTTRIRLGMLDPTPYDDIPYERVCCEEHTAKNLAIAERSIVMLENNGVLPLDEKKIRTLAVIGPNADSVAALEGNYCGTSDNYVTFLRGLRERFSGRVLYSQGCHLFRDRTSSLARENDRLSEAMACAENADAVILCVGLDATIEGEEGDAANEFASGDKIDLRLPEGQRTLVKAMRETGKPLIIVCAAGSAINTETKPDALLHVWYPGAQGGRALARVIFGDTSPSGKLPVTFYKTAEQLPEFTDYSMANRTYRYTVSNILYPFGYGLTYSQFELTGFELIEEQNTVVVSARNCGQRACENVVQIYIKDYSECAVPNVSLCGFKRISLAAGEEGSFEIPLGSSTFTSVDENGVRGVRSKVFTLYADFSQPGENCMQIRIEA